MKQFGGKGDSAIVEKYKARPAMLRLADTYEIFAKPIKWKFTKTDLI
jgi:hypothetical protein